MEEFYTLQGEGFNMGSAAYFIRIGGCDVGCKWCDTKRSWNPENWPTVDIDPVIENAARTKAGTVVVTGGEPSLYPLEYLSSQLKAKGVKTMIETSGANILDGEWDWICLSPKKNKPPHPSLYPRANELKMIIENIDDLRWAEENAALVNDSCVLYLQAEWSKSQEVINDITGYIMENPQWRVSLQAHKFMNIP
ncbi:MAG: 7-carboxy-7-deazaguanine synthase QueE [Chlorobi bacterium]|nr:7-carboxy-7-deazaguanine synthase QueE [Chlorobiota bacterium]